MNNTPMLVQHQEGKAADLSAFETTSFILLLHADWEGYC
jgi:hypothetical protein